jgi:hypothetical protein
MDSFVELGMGIASHANGVISLKTPIFLVHGLISNNMIWEI